MLHIYWNSQYLSASHLDAHTIKVSDMTKIDLYNISRECLLLK